MNPKVLDLFNRAMKDDWDGWNLKLMSVPTVDGLPDSRVSLVIVALVAESLHIRIFGAYGQIVVDKPEGELASGLELTELKQLINQVPLLAASELSKEQRTEILEKATSISGHTNGDGDAAWELYKLARDATAALGELARARPDMLMPHAEEVQHWPAFIGDGTERINKKLSTRIKLGRSSFTSGDLGSSPQKILASQIIRYVWGKAYSFKLGYWKREAPSWVKKASKLPKFDRQSYKEWADVCWEYVMESDDMPVFHVH